MQLIDAYQKVNGDTCRISLEDWLIGSNAYVNQHTMLYTVESDNPDGDTISIPDTVYNSETDALIVINEGFMLMPYKQYTETNNVINVNIPVRAGDKFYIIIYKTHKNEEIMEELETPSGDKVYRKLGADGSIIELATPIVNTGVKKIFVFDAKFRTVKKWYSGQKDLNVKDYSTATDNSTSKHNTDILVRDHENAYAAHYCRSIGGDLGTITVMLAVGRNKEYIDLLDPTINEYPDFALMNWGFGKSYVWSSTEHNATLTWIVHPSGKAGSTTKTYERGVVPILELD